MILPLRPAALIAGLLTVVIGLSGCAVTEAPETGPVFGSGEALVNGTTITVEVAHDTATRRLGLMGRTGIGQDRGMLFLFPEPDVHRFWMKGMLIPIDVVWLKDGQVIGVRVDIPSPGPDGPVATFDPPGPIDAALELGAGSVRRLGIGSGDRVEIRVDSLVPVR